MTSSDYEIRVTGEVELSVAECQRQIPSITTSKVRRENTFGMLDM